MSRRSVEVTADLVLRAYRLGLFPMANQGLLRDTQANLKAGQDELADLAAQKAAAQTELDKARTSI